MPPRARLPKTPAVMGHESPDHVFQDATPAPAGARTYDFYMNQLSGLRVDPAAAQGSVNGAAPPEKPAARLPLSAATGGGAKSDDPFNWSSSLFPAGGDTWPPAASDRGAKPELRPYELPPNPFDMVGTPRPSSTGAGGEGKLPEKPAGGSPLNTFFTVDPPPRASGGGPEKLKVNTSVVIEPAGKMQNESLSDAGTPGKPVTEPPLATPAAPSGAKPGKAHVEASVDIEPPATGPTGAGGPSVPTPSPAVLSEMQMLQETQRQGMQQQADMQKMAIENQVLTARLKLEMDLTTAVTDFIKKQGEGIKHAAAG